ncbi:MAG: DNA repair protein RecN [Muribaculaceae bacterium]|nr:DNA repair protein RecN [Muribaculaceae bacterium]
MLKRLFISNYALIDKLELDWLPGLTIITGETGAGKSIIIGALSLILGERCDTKSVRDASRKTVVEATFNISGFALKPFFEQNDVEYFEEECIVRREIAPGGRSRAFINDTPVNVSALKDLATHLIDIHSQHSNMLLAKPAFQLSVIDSIADNGALRDQYSEQYTQLKAAEKRLNQLRLVSEKSHTQEDYLRFQLQQLQEMNLSEGEDIELENLQNKLSNINDLKEALWEVESRLNGDEQSTLEQLTAVAARLEATEHALPETTGMAQRVRDAIVDLKDIAQTVGHLQEDLNDDPAQLARVDDRLHAIYSMERKHGVDNVDALIQVQHRYEQQLGDITHNDELIAQLEETVTQLGQQAEATALMLSESRRKVSRSFAEKMQELAQKLGMKNLQFKVDINHTSLMETGCDELEFKVAFNKNQQPMPVKDTASGGEISRVMLCIKTIVAHTMQLPTIIFDEVDTGVSGDVANMVGDMMSDIAQNIQVLTITHLPQVAAHGKHHKKVVKTDNDTDSLTHVLELDDHEHVIEIARMLSGKDLNEAAIENAKSLIATNR